MDEEREMELELDKVYTLPDFEYIEYDGHCLAIAPEIAKWIVLENNEQYEILTMFAGGSDLQTVLEQFEENQEDIIAVLTQLEAKHIETSETRSIFSNTRLDDDENTIIPDIRITKNESGWFEIDLSYNVDGEVYDLASKIKLFSTQDEIEDGDKKILLPDSIIQAREYLSVVGNKLRINQNHIFEFPNTHSLRVEESVLMIYIILKKNTSGTSRRFFLL